MSERVIRALVLLDKGQELTHDEHRALVTHMRQRAPGWEIRLTNTDYCWSTHRGSFAAFVSRMVETFDVFVRAVRIGEDATCGRGSYQIAKNALAGGKRVRTWNGLALNPVASVTYDSALQLYRLSPT